MFPFLLAKTLCLCPEAPKNLGLWKMKPKAHAVGFCFLPPHRSDVLVSMRGRDRAQAADEEIKRICQPQSEHSWTREPLNPSLRIIVILLRDCQLVDHQGSPAREGC